MSIFIDEKTRKRILRSPHSGDIEYDLSGDSTISNEDVPLIGNWEDYTGSGEVNSRNQQMWAGVTNQLDGTDPGIEGEKLPVLTERGNKKQTTRTRVIKQYHE